MTTSRVCLNGRFSGTLRPTGTQVVAYHLFDAIVRQPRNMELVILADPAFPGVADWANVPQTELVPTPFSDWRRSRAQLWEQFVLPWRARQLGCELIHHPITTCPRWPFGLRSLVTVHDLNFYHHPEWVSRSFRGWLLATAVPGIQAADYVVAISDYVLDDVRRTLRIGAERSSRVYNGFKKSEQSVSAVERQASDAPVIFMLNAWQPHKNLSRVLDAWPMLRRDHPTLELHLAGRPQAQFRSQPELQAKLQQPGVKLLGYLTDEELAQAYARADVFCYPSLEEGFGLPIIEAMSAGVPVVTSNVSCLPEIAGDAGILVDPYSVEDIARGLNQALQIESRSQYVERGRRVAERFSWEDSARQYIEIYRKLLKIAS